jgi:UDP-N-acetylmuramoyl-tripeptide--D-alanyl-D-alanine ligase
VKLDAATIASATGGRVLRAGPYGAVSTDTRALPAGSWFLALRGDRFDGHAFLGAAAAAGAAGCIVDTDPGPAWTGGVVLVTDTLRALQDLGRHARATFRGPVVGLTGSSGKTTTRALTALALRPLGIVHQTTGNLNNHIGVPLTLLACPSDADAMLVEMGTSSPGEIAVLADLARPNVRLIVNVGPAHLQELGGLDGVALEKGALFRAALPGDVVCVNADDPRVAAIPSPAGVRRLTWGSAGEVALLDAEIDPATLSTRARWQTPEGIVGARIPAPGHHIAHDAAAALAVAVALGVDPLAAAAALADYAPVGMRLRSEPLPGGGTALNDAYNANPASMEASLRLLASLPGRRAAVLGDMLELGADEAAWHQRVADLAASLDLDAIVLVGPRMSAAACPGAHRFANPDDAVAPLRAWLGPDSVVLFKGSRGARVERVLQRLTGPLAAGEGGDR